MAKKIALQGVTTEQVEWIRSTILREVPKAKIKFFGTRASGTSKTYSDLDTSIDAGAPLSFLTLSKLKEIFSESQLPFKIDLIDYRSVDDEFKAIIDGTSIQAN